MTTVVQQVTRTGPDAETPAGGAGVGSGFDAASVADQAGKLTKLIELGIALSAERNHDRLLETILLEAKAMTNADGGTLYLRTDDDHLSFEILRNDTLNTAMGGTTGKPVPLPRLPLVDKETGELNWRNVASYAANSGTTVNIADAYEAEGFDFSGTRKFDEKTGYRSKSFLTVPLKNYQGEVIGVLQLINARRADGAVIPFSPAIQPIIEALASQAAVAIDNQQLIMAQRRLLDSFIEVIAGAIDAKSPYTGGHCQRVPVITKMLAKAACESHDPRFREFNLTEDEWYELHLACWLHDCGKVTTPEYVVDKATKLETIYNRIHEVRTRFEVLRRDAEIEYLRKRLAGGGDEVALRREFDRKVKQLEDDWAFVAKTNQGGEGMDDEDIERLHRIGRRPWTRYFDNTLGLSWEEDRRMPRDVPTPAQETLLADKAEHLVGQYNKGELYNLSTRRGTLAPEEREKINEHIVLTIEMLEQLPFPRHLKNVPEYAGGHHEKMDGTGYPKGLTGDQMSLPARMMAIADIYEALTASDRPYKKPKTLSETISIMVKMRDNAHIDPDLFDLFLQSGVFRQYAEEYLLPEQVDDVDITPFLTTEAAE